MLTRPGAWALVWHAHLDDPTVRAALELRRLAAGVPPVRLVQERRWAAWRLGDRAMLVVNASRAPLIVAPQDLMPGVDRWRDAVNGDEIVGSLCVPPRSPAWVRTQA